MQTFTFKSAVPLNFIYEPTWSEIEWNKLAAARLGQSYSHKALVVNESDLKFENPANTLYQTTKFNKATHAHLQCIHNGFQPKRK
jgi:hypothetical protein